MGPNQAISNRANLSRLHVTNRRSDRPLSSLTTTTANNNSLIFTGLDFHYLIENHSSRPEPLCAYSLAFVGLLGVLYATLKDKRSYLILFAFLLAATMITSGKLLGYRELRYSLAFNRSCCDSACRGRRRRLADWTGLDWTGRRHQVLRQQLSTTDLALEINRPSGGGNFWNVCADVIFSLAPLPALRAPRSVGLSRV